MNLTKIGAGLRKELMLLSRDIHALGVLFVMPAIFILIMSLAMRDAFSQHSTVEIDVAMMVEENSTASTQLVQKLQTLDGFVWRKSSAKTSREFTSWMIKEDVLVAVVVKRGFEETAKSGGAIADVVSVVVNPKAQPVVIMAFEQAVSAVVGSIVMGYELGALNPWMTHEEKAKALAPKQWFTQEYTTPMSGVNTHPTSVQQSVPAWLIFSMFFIIVPIANTFVAERNNGTLSRLAVMNISVSQLLMAKFIPYFVINHIQFLLMISVGVFVVPLLGGDALIVEGLMGRLCVVAMVLSFATISYALLVASWVRTTDQASTFGGLLNIIFAALGGIMIPLFVMPPVMQQLSVLSPMSWALESFLGIFLNNSSLGDIGGELGALVVFGAVCLSVAWWKLRRELTL
jgi:ABC-2 type transport system permease protein